MTTTLNQDLVRHCGCGREHLRQPSALDVDPGRWRRIRTAILARDNRQCQVRGQGSPHVAADGSGAAVCGRAATVCGHVLSRALGGCDHPANLRAECKEHSDRAGAIEGNQLRAAIALVQAQRASLTQSKDVDFLTRGSEQDPAIQVASLSGIHAGQEGGHGRSNLSLAKEHARSSELIRTPGPDDSVWDNAPWLDRFRDVPPDATWPRLMSLPHPDAVGSYGEELCDQFAMRHNGAALRWWQQLAGTRILEHAADGRLVWMEYLVTVARQVGKSWLLRELAFWRLRHGAERWGEQLVLHTGKDMGILRTVLRPAQAWAQGQGWNVSRNNMEPGISTRPHMEGSVWVIKAKDAVYGQGAGNPMVDEAWDVAGTVVDDGALPTMVEQPSPQLGLWSTAHRRATGLVLQRRRAALEHIDTPRRLLLLEWSAAADRDHGDVAGWREASPHWTEQREQLVSDAWDRVRRGESVDPEEPDPMASFDTQWLNRWPAVNLLREDDPDELIATPEQWTACADADAAPDPLRLLVVAVEDDLGRGAAAAAAALTPDGRIVVGGHWFTDLREAVDWAEDTALAAEDAVLLAGASLLDHPELEDLDLTVEPAGSVETRAALPQVRALVRARKLAHDGDAELAASVLGARVPPNVTGDAMLIRGDALLRCVAWTVHRAHRERW